LAGGAKRALSLEQILGEGQCPPKILAKKDKNVKNVYEKSWGRTCVQAGNLK